RHPRAAQGAGADAGPDGPAHERVAGLPVADRAGQELRVDRDAVPHLVGPRRQARRPVPGRADADLSAGRTCGKNTQPTEVTRWAVFAPEAGDASPCAEPRRAPAERHPVRRAAGPGHSIDPRAGRAQGFSRWNVNISCSVPSLVLNSVGRSLSPARATQTV